MILFKTILPVIFGGGSAYLLVRNFFPLKTNPLWKGLVFIGFLPVMTTPSYSNESFEVLMFFHSICLVSGTGIRRDVCAKNLCCRYFVSGSARQQLFIL